MPPKLPSQALALVVDKYNQSGLGSDPANSEIANGNKNALSQRFSGLRSEQEFPVVQSIIEEGRNKQSQLLQGNDWRKQLDSKPESLKSKIHFDDSVYSQNKAKINNQLSQLFNRKSPLLQSVLDTASQTDYVTQIKVRSSESPDGDGARGEYDKVNKDISVYDCDYFGSDMVVTSIVHEATHAYQERLKAYPTLKQKFEDGSFMEAFEKDMSSDTSVEKLPQNERWAMELRKGTLSEILNDKYGKSELPYEVQARIMEDVMANPQRAERMFPETLTKMKDIDSEYKQLEGLRERLQSSGKGK